MSYIILSDDELMHWKYIDRKKVNGKWVYTYDDDKLKSDVKKVISDPLGKKAKKNLMNERANYYTKRGQLATFNKSSEYVSGAKKAQNAASKGAKFVPTTDGEKSYVRDKVSEQHAKIKLDRAEREYENSALGKLDKVKIDAKGVAESVKQAVQDKLGYDERNYRDATKEWLSKAETAEKKAKAKTQQAEKTQLKNLDRLEKMSKTSKEDNEKAFWESFDLAYKVGKAQTAEAEATKNRIEKAEWYLEAQEAYLKTPLGKLENASEKLKNVSKKSKDTIDAAKDWLSNLFERDDPPTPVLSPEGKENIIKENIIKENVIKENVIKEKTIPEKTIPEKKISEKTMPEKKISEKTMPEKKIEQEVTVDTTITRKKADEAVKTIESEYKEATKLEQELFEKTKALKNSSDIKAYEQAKAEFEKAFDRSMELRDRKDECQKAKQNLNDKLDDIEHDLALIKSLTPTEETRQKEKEYHQQIEDAIDDYYKIINKT